MVPDVSREHGAFKMSRTPHPMTRHRIPQDSKPHSSKQSNEVTKCIKNCASARRVYRTVSCWAFLAQGQQIQY